MRCRSSYILMLVLIGLSMIGRQTVFGALYSHGVSAGDTIITDIDDTLTTEISLSQPFTFYTKSYNKLYISTNGYVTVNNSDIGYEPTTVAINTPYVAAFWADTVFKSDMGGSLQYRMTNDASILQQIADDIDSVGGSLLLDKTEWALVITWFNASSVGLKPAVNTFQMILTADCLQSFVIFVYEKLEWTRTWLLDYAVAGFNEGNPYLRQYLLTGSGTSDIRNLTSYVVPNIGEPGKQVFRVDGNKMEQTQLCDLLQFGANCFIDARCLAVQITERESRGWVGISRQECEALGYCYDDIVYKVPWCFARKQVCDIHIRDPDDPACLAAHMYPLRDCIPDGKRVVRARCMALGCCWDPDADEVPSRCFIPL